MRFPRRLLPLAVLGIVACGPTYVVQSAPQSAPQRVPEPPPAPRVPPLEVSVVRPDEGRVLIQTSRAAYVAVFEMVPGRGVSLVYPQPMRPRDVMLTGLNWVNVYWTIRPRFASNDTRYIYAVASDTPLLLSDAIYDQRYLQQRLGSTFWASSPSATAQAISREFVRAQPDEWWGEDMYSVPLRDGRMDLIVRVARVYCPGGVYYDVREDLADHIWCPARGTARRGEHPVASVPDSVFSSVGRRIPRHVEPTNRTPIFRVPKPTDVGEQQGHPINQPQQAPPRTYPRTQPQPQNPTIPTQNQPQQPPPAQNPPPGQNPPQTQPQTPPPQNQPPQTQPEQPTPNDTNTHDNNGRRAHGDPRNADPRGNGNGYGNGGRTTPPSTQPPASNPPSSNPQSQQGNGQGNGHASGNNGNGNNGNGNNGNGNNGNGNNGKSPNEAKPGHDVVPTTPPSKGAAALMNRLPGQKKQGDKKAANDSTDTKKKP